MNNHQLVIYDFKVLFNILDEIKEYLNFDVIHIPKKNYTDLIDNYSDSIIVSKKAINELDSIIVIKNLPLKIQKFNELVNTNFLKKHYNQQSNKPIGSYYLDFNSKKIFLNNTYLSLTEKEIKLIDYLKKSNHPISTTELQKKVWGYVSSLETHTVETHVYRLRKKFLKTFKDKNFILSNKNGYFIN